MAMSTEGWETVQLFGIGTGKTDWMGYNQNTPFPQNKNLLGFGLLPLTHSCHPWTRDNLGRTNNMLEEGDQKFSVSHVRSRYLLGSRGRIKWVV